MHILFHSSVLKPSLSFFCGLVLLLSPFLAHAADYKPTEGILKVAFWDAKWQDESRDREIPVRIYYPEDASVKGCPVIIFSHGLGGSREGYAYLGRYWASHGYVSVHLQHEGSDSELISGTERPLRKMRKLKKAAADTQNYENRPQDVRYAIDELHKLSSVASFPLSGRMDLEKLAVAGHSFGSYTVLALAGQKVGRDGHQRSLGPDPRIKAAIAMSSFGSKATDLDDAYSKIALPIFHMTGTKDELEWGKATPITSKAETRRVAYDHTQHAPACLLVLKDGDHLVFSGARRHGDGQHDEEYHKLICVASTAFWDATLKGDAAALAWLENGGFSTLLGASGTFEHKRP